MSAPSAPQPAKSTDPPSTQKDAKPPAALEEDDEFEDFPVEDWPSQDQELPEQTGGVSTTHLWEESWDDDDTSEDFSRVLKVELEKVKGGK